jgi:hypothetical protein
MYSAEEEDMSNRTVYWVTPGNDGDWRVLREVAERAASVHENKDDALAEAKRMAKAAPLGQVKVQKADGKIQEEFTYGKDPASSPG